jgi:hypothetical protein
MNLSSRLSRLVCCLAYVSALVALAAGQWQRSRQPPPAPSPLAGLGDWDVPQLVRHLRNRGLALRLVPTGQAARISDKAYLTATELGFADLNLLLMVRDHAARWSGAVYCERVRPAGSRDDQVLLWGDCGLSVGPFIFFGDPRLLREIRAALEGGGQDAEAGPVD